MSATDTAIIDCMYGIIEIVSTRTGIPHSDFARVFERQRDVVMTKARAQQVAPEDAGAALAVFALMISSCNTLAEAHQLHDAPPGGHA